MPDVNENVLRRAHGQKLSGKGSKEMFLSLKIKSYLASTYDSNNRKYEPYIIADDRFNDSLTRARKSLGIGTVNTNNPPVDEDDIEKWAVFVVTGSKVIRRNTQEFSKAVDAFYDVVTNVLDELKLPRKWDYYIAVCLLSGKPPIDNAFDFDLVDVVLVNEDGVTLKFKNGLSKAQYDKVWEIISENLREPITTQKVSKDSERNLAIYKRKNEGFTYGQIAKEFFPAQAKLDQAAAEDTVKKIVRREREKFNAGTKLAS